MLEVLDLSLRHPPEVYANILPDLQKTFRRAGQRLYDRRQALVILIHGWSSVPLSEVGLDLYHCLDPRGCAVYPAQEQPDKAGRHHYLRSYWKRLPPRRRAAIFYHSWYGRVLADRVQGNIPVQAWRRAYREIKQFERQLSNHGTIVLKFWLHLDRDEHARRMGEVEADQVWDHPTRWEAAFQAVDEAILKTNLVRVPWIVVPAQDRHYASAYLLHNMLRHIVPALELKGKAWRKLPGDEIITPIEAKI